MRNAAYGPRASPILFLSPKIEKQPFLCVPLKASMAETWPSLLPRGYLPLPLSYFSLLFRLSYRRQTTEAESGISSLVPPTDPRRGTFVTLLVNNCTSDAKIVAAIALLSCLAALTGSCRVCFAKNLSPHSDGGGTANVNRFVFPELAGSGFCACLLCQFLPMARPLPNFLRVTGPRSLPPGLPPLVPISWLPHKSCMRSLSLNI